MDDRASERPSEIAKAICDHVNYNEPLRRIAKMQRSYPHWIFLSTSVQLQRTCRGSRWLICEKRRQKRDNAPCARITGLTRSNNYSFERKFGSDVTETADERKSVIEKEDSVS